MLDSKETVLRKISKLLKLSASPNVNEAATAAAMAQDLMMRHGISRASADLSGETTEPAEPIADFGEKPEGWLDANGRDTWRGWMAQAVAKHHGCRAYRRRRAGLPGFSLEVIGRASDVETVRYLHSYLAREVERLTTEHGAGMGVTWRNNFRIGVVDAIRATLAKQAEATKAAVRSEAQTSTALVLVDRSLARIKEMDAEVQAFIDGKNLSSRGGSHAKSDGGARSAGRVEGAKISIGSARAGLASGAKALNS